MGVAGEVLWRDGDRWRDLTAAVWNAGRVTAVSENGTVTFISAYGRRYKRQPVEGGHVLHGDGTWSPFETFTATPCGIVFGWKFNLRCTTPLRFAVAGFVPAWPTTPLGHAALREVISGRPPTAAGHPAEPCPARYCRRRSVVVR